MNKVMTKRIWSTLGLPTPAFALLEPGFDADEVVRKVGLPMAVKPVSEGSSLGFTKVIHASQLQAAFELAYQLDHQVIAESFVTGREFTCALLQDPTGRVNALPVIEIEAPEGQYDYQNKYFGNATRYSCPAKIPAEIEARMRSLSVSAFESLECSGWARADLMWDGSSSPTLLEINTSPGMTDHSLVPMAAREAGLSYEQLVLRITASASLKISAWGER
jgi:D-alanine-D-alanine ligase